MRIVRLRDWRRWGGDECNAATIIRHRRISDRWLAMPRWQMRQDRLQQLEAAGWLLEYYLDRQFPRCSLCGANMVTLQYHHSAFKPAGVYWHHCPEPTCLAIWETTSSATRRRIR